MNTIAIIGAGPGLGAAAARRFGHEGYAVALISRSQERAEALAAELTSEGITAAGFAADVRRPTALTSALERAAHQLGAVEVLQYSPVPHEDFMHPVLETTVEDLRGALEFSVLGPLAAVTQVLPGMRTAGTGTILFVNGGTAVRPKPGFAGTSIAFAGESAYAQMLHSVLADASIHVSQLIIPGAIAPASQHSSPTAIAQLLWTMHTERTTFRHFTRDIDA
ncbi:short-chain dehydrogenase of unknown substrate specificity [Sanguibacter keddieii DSM 10542]|uniref:Short-chain alcohol dehydrogenase n=1 Tax=Sanguibacter keddieii (strain ATCC 51767 / DSM 10542 / NCFB 3025 / ST-74) TaxID=446469 RepID=D1BHN5_SANKS|nr:SDR family NAD(P)-dependent oxidoreductase [Sanguibacter keddieii]ACZ21955.1 short-chain dehydrogenase of unknown substrate specificity [Sanguibacter keddieii DSM 10542]